jgi:N-acetylneuraminate synthase
MSEPHIHIAERRISEIDPAFLIAEIGQAHDGSLGMAHAYIDAAADAGADAVKFQTHIASAESTRDEEFRVPLSGQDATRIDYWRRMEFTAEQWKGLAAHAATRQIIFFSSPFSLEAVKLLTDVGVPAWKVGSGETGSAVLLDAMVATKKPILLSTGMSTYEEIDAALKRCTDQGADVALLQCTSAYPLPMKEVGLNILGELRTRFERLVGLSDHSGYIWPSVAAIALGASIAEVHIVLDRRSYGPDVSSSLTVDQLSQLVEARDALAEMKNHIVDKDAVAERLETTRQLFQKSVALVQDQPAGTVLDRAMLTTKKPGSGIPSEDIDSVVGRRLSRAVPSDRLIRTEDLDD